MTAALPGTVNAHSDRADRLVAADEPLRALHLRCGGVHAGTIAVPALLEAVRKARAYGLKLARPLVAQDGADTITAWAEIEPGEDGCAIVLRHWQSRALPPEDAGLAGERRVAIDRQTADLIVRLDARQRVLFADALADDLRPLAARMNAGMGQAWTDFVQLTGNAHRQPLHWRLLDGAPLTAEGSVRRLRATLIPVDGEGIAPAGFELLLTSDEPFVAPRPAATAADAADPRLIGRDVAPALRQPIARIIANAETIRTRLAGPLADEYAGYAADIVSAGEHLQSLVEDLSALEVIEDDGFVPAPDVIDLADVARRAAGILGVRAREKDIAIDAPRLGETLPAVGEFRRVLQILLNLIGNAVRYAPAGSQVWLRAESEDGTARLVVADQGPGLSPEQQARLFGKFERLGRSGDGGTGLGLYISRRLARAMGGDLTVESAAGQGARFILTLPAGSALPVA